VIHVYSRVIGLVVGSSQVTHPRPLAEHAECLAEKRQLHWCSLTGARVWPSSASSGWGNALRVGVDLPAAGALPWPLSLLV